MEALSKNQLRQLKNQLLQEKADAEKKLELSDNFGMEQSLGVMTGELSTYDNHPADIASEEYERGKDLALNELTEHYLEEIGIALENIEIGQYGVCLTCGKAIPYERLEAIPTTRYCIKHSPDQALSQRRPVEEQFMQPPFGRTSVDERDDETQFDGEDAWQIVESWGTSNTPAMAEDPNDQYDYNRMYIEAEEREGYVEPLESFLATDIFGQNVIVIRNNEYYKYIENNEGDHLLEPDRQDMET